MNKRGSWGCTAALAIALGACGDDGGSSEDSSTSAAPGSTSADDATTIPSNPSDSGAQTTAASTGGDTTGPGPMTSGSGSTGNDDADSSGSSGAAGCEGMSFFATSVGSGENGGNLGGLAGADATCQTLADAVGQGGCTWHAYLSTSTEDARDRIGTGPWENAMGDVIAADVAALHTEGLSNGMPQHVFDENGVEVPGNEHDILTGSNEDGTYMMDATCQDWTSDSGQDEARVGHSDIPGNPMFSPSWNSAHTVGGCGEGDLQGTGGAGRLYCFAL